MAEQVESSQFGATIQMGSWRRLTTGFWWFMLLSCVGVSVYSTKYFLWTPRDGHFSGYVLPLRLHIAGGMGALLAGPWQFSKNLRARALNLHRWLGRFYLMEVALGSIAGFTMATVSEEGLAHSPRVRRPGHFVVFYRIASLP